MRIILFFIFICISTTLLGQQDSVSKREKWRLDTNYTVSYPDKLVLGVYISGRRYDLFFHQNLTPDSTGRSQMKYVARGNVSMGIDFSYDKISFSLGKSFEATEFDKYKQGITKTQNLSFSLNSKRYRLEGAYRKFTGYYDEYTGRRDTLFNDSLPYYQMPDMYSKSFRLKGFYFFNKKKRFSYSATFNNTARQLKTAGSFLIISNLYKYSLQGDSTWISRNNRVNYAEWGGLNSIMSHGASLNIGYAFNLVVFKRFFVSVMGSTGFAFEKLKFSNEDQNLPLKKWQLGWNAGDLRVSFGYNGPKFYMLVFTTFDVNKYVLNGVTLESQLVYGSFNFGYRFKMKETKAVQWLKNNKFYKMI